MRRGACMPPEQRGDILKTLTTILLAAAATNLVGCATVLNGTHTSYVIQSEPIGAAVKLTNGMTCTTPCTLQLKRKDDLRVDLTAPGYKPTYVLVQSKLGGSAFGNALLGGGIGAVVDGSNGASNRLYPRPLNVRLAREGSPDGALLLSKDGKVVKTVKAHNDSVRADVGKTVGPRLAGLEGNDQQ